MERLRYSEFQLVGADTAKLRGPSVDVLLCSGYIPAPMLFGALIDSTCRLWEMDGGGAGASKCQGSSATGTGSCLLYDTDQLRWRTFGVSLAVQFVQLTFAVLLYFAIRHRKFGAGAAAEPPVSGQSPAVDDADAKPAVEELTLLDVSAANPQSASRG